ncbi:hypothetical protein DL767_002190 [Monosporascus sp. MG133]|nr:hypothetical protein DL767_002190 [Monosporascus sp. MG133]
MGLNPSELAALAYAEPPITPRGVSRTLSVLSIIFLVLATVVISLRIWVRAWMLKGNKGWGLDDTLAVMGFIPFAVFCVCAIFGAYYGLGTLDKDLNRFLIMRGTEYMAYCQVTITISVSFTKASIGVTVMLISTGTGISGVVGLLITCKPPAAKWNPGLGTCSGYDLILLGSYAFSWVVIATDLACAVIPYLIVRNLEMPSRSKYSIIIILGIGALASVACVVRIPYLSYFTKTENVLYGIGYVILWSAVESAVGIIAGSLPSLRKLFGYYFETPNNSYQRGSGARAGAQNTIGGTPFSMTGREHELETLGSNGIRRNSVYISSKGKSGWHPLGDGSSTRCIARQTTVRVETESLGGGDSRKSSQELNYTGTPNMGQA